jgi:hypothetical protein
VEVVIDFIVASIVAGAKASDQRSAMAIMHVPGSRWPSS